MKHGNIIEEWANLYSPVVRWLGKLQKKQRSAYRLWQFCNWCKLNPDELLKLKKDPSSKEAEMLLDRFVAEEAEGFTNSVKVNISSTVRSFFKHNYCDLSSSAGKIDLEKVKPYHRPTQAELRKLWLSCYNPRDRSIISLSASTAIAKETIINLKWKHLEEKWESQEIPHISVPPELIKGHGRGKYRGVRQETFLTPEAKQDLLNYKEWLERKMGRETTEEDYVYVSVYEPYDQMTYSTLGTVLTDLQERTNINVSLHDFRRYVETALESISMVDNWRRKIRGRKVKGEEAPYSQPAIEELRQKYREAIPALEFIREQVNSEQMRRRQLLDTARLLGFGDERLRRLEEVLAKAKNVDEAIEEFKKLKDEAEDPPEENHVKIVKGEQALVDHLKLGWTLIKELNRGKYLLKSA